MNRQRQLTTAMIAFLSLAACTGTGPEPTSQTRTHSEPSSELAGTAWELVEIQSMNDERWAPDDPSRYTLELNANGSATMTLDCNRGRSSWSSEQSGQLEFSPVASTSALCQDDGLSERYASQFEWVRSYVLRDGHLFLATYADGAIIELRLAD